MDGLILNSTGTQTHSTLVDVLRSRAAFSPDRTAYVLLVDGEQNERAISYGELDRQARAVAAELQDKVAPGDRALLLYPHGLEYVAAFLGCVYAGVIAVPAYPPRLNRLNDRSLPRIHAILQDASPAIALTTAAIRTICDPFLEKFPSFRSMKWIATDDLPEARAEQWKPVELNGRSRCFLQYTSGSTSAPRGVVVTHENILFNERMMAEVLESTEENVVVSWLPMFHDMGLIGCILQPLYSGFKCILMSPLDFLQKPLRWLRAISRYRANIGGAPNFAFDLCVSKTTPEQRAQLDLSCWDVAFVSAEPVRQRTLERFVETFAPCGFRRQAFCPYYGLAEATLFVTGGAKSSPPVYCSLDSAALEHGLVVAAGHESENKTVLVGCGHAWAGQEVAIVDAENGSRCPPNRVGEIWVRGTSVAEGYWNRSDDSASLFRAFVKKDGEGPFLRTGDLGFLHDGELFITGRARDLIILDGLNYYPQDIEATVDESHPAVRVGCSIAFSANVEGQERLIVACEIERQWKPDTHEAIAGAIREAIAGRHGIRVHDVSLLKLGGIPKTSSGKLQRHACRRAYLEGTLNRFGGSQ